MTVLKSHHIWNAALNLRYISRTCVFNHRVRIWRQDIIKGYRMFGVRIMIVMMIIMLIDSTSGQVCFGCTGIAGSILLSPLSYRAMRSNVFNGTQPSNEGCTSVASIDGQVTIDCGQGTTLIDCNRGFNGGNYSDLSGTFAWNRTTSVAEQVSIVFRFDQQVNISRITLFFWNSPSNSIIIPNVRLYGSNDDSITPSNEINITPGSVRRDRDERRRWFININDNGVQFQYLRIEMSFRDDSEWIFLSEVEFCGNTAPYNITQPSTDYDAQIVSLTTTMATLTCSLNVTIPSSMTVTWLHNGTIIMTPPNEVLTAGSTTTLVIRNPQPSDVGVYQCVFTDSANGWILRRNIRLFIGAPQIIYPPSILHPITFTNSTSSVQLMCSLNVEIPPDMTVLWIYNSNPFNTVPPDEVTQTGNTATLVIQNPQPSDVGLYQCIFAGLGVGGSILLEFSNSTSPSIDDVITTTTNINMDTTISISNPFVSATATLTTAISNTSYDIPTTTDTPTNSEPPSSSDDSTNVGVIVAIIVVIIVVVIIAIVVLVIIFKWKNRKEYAKYDKTTYLHEEDTPYYSADVKSHHGRETESNNGGLATKPDANKDQQLYAIPDKQKSTEPQRSSTDFGNNSNAQTPSLDQDYENNVELDIYASPDLPERTEDSTVFDSQNEENPIYSEAINPSIIIDNVSFDSFSDDESLCPYASIYADPLPLAKSEGPPIVSNKNIEPLSQLGMGQFGEVMLANTVGLSYQYLGIGSSNDSTVSIKVAVKMLKPSPSEEIRKAFEKEIKFMSRLKDDNVIKLLGICTTGTLFIMMQYMENGDLNNYLQKLEFTYEAEKLPAENEITLNALVYISYQVASGMKYLSSCKFIHRDLAARNILVGVNYTVKIADFGMSQNLYSAYYYKVGGRIFLPIRWMAYECFFGKFSIKTDVWAFGITLFEVFTLCKCQPFPNLSDQEMIEDAIKGANRMIPHQPEFCPNNIYEIMEGCFHHEPSKRVGFNVLCDQLNECYSNIL